MASFIYPSNAELRYVEQDKIPRLQADRPIFKFFPTRNTDYHLVMWEQQDNFLGLQQVRGLNGQPSKVKAVGGKRFQMEPGVYGEFSEIDEMELTIRRKWGSFNEAIDITDLVMLRQDQLLQRRLDRMEYIGWQLVTQGKFTVPLPVSAQPGHADTFTVATPASSPTVTTLTTGVYEMQSYTAATVWATSATSTPLLDFRYVKLQARGHSVSFGTQATAYMNQTTFNQLITNTNASDLFGRRQGGMGGSFGSETLNNLNDVNRLLAGDDLPQIAIYDEGYIDDAGVFQLFVPNNKVAVIGKRSSSVALGEFQMTRNANNPDLSPGPYMRVIDRLELTVPRTIEVHDGWNGGISIEFPSSIVIMTV